MGVLLGIHAKSAEAQSASPRCAERRAASSDLLSIDLDSLLDTKVITASKFEESVSDAPGVISVISRDDLRRFGGLTLGEVLERVPGVLRSTNSYSDRSLMAVRGNQTRPNGGHVLLLIDGRPTREVLEGGITTDIVESFPIGVLERIEIVKGPGSVLYGSDAYSAVINLITIAPEGSGARMAALGGSSGAMGTSAEGLFTCGRFSLVGAAQFQRRDTWTTQYRFVDRFTGASGSSIVAVPYEAPGMLAKAAYRGVRGTLALTKTEFPAILDGITGIAPSRRTFADVGYDRTMSPRWNLSLSGSYTRHVNQLPAPALVHRTSDELVVEWTNTAKLSGQTTITAGGLYDYIDGTEIYTGVTPNVPVVDGRRHSGAAYLQIDHRPHPKLKLIGGVQANKIGQLSLDIVPRAGAIWSPAARVNVKVLWGQAFRAPSLEETLLNHPAIVGNVALKPEKVRSFDAAVAYRADQFEGSVSYFHNHETNAIVTDYVSTPLTYVNLGETTFNGFEIDGKYYINKRLYLVGSTLYQRNHDAAGHPNVATVPHFGAKAGLSVDTESGFRLSLFDSYEGAAPTRPSQLNPLPVARHLLHAHVRLDVSRYLSATAKDGIAVVAHINNLRNTEVWMPDASGSADTLPVERGRVFYAGVEVAVGGGRRLVN
jgi:outer membrane receptor for ferrienterochelin and colicins